MKCRRRIKDLLASTTIHGHFSRGSMSLMLLVICLFAVLIAQLALFLTNQEFRETIVELRGRQLQELCYSAMDGDEYHNIIYGKGILAEVKLEPGGVKGKLLYDSSRSEDGLLSGLKLQAVSADGVERKMCLNTLELPPTLVDLAASYQLIYKTDIEGTEYLEDTQIYTSSEEVRVPQVEFLYNVGLDPVNDDKLFKNGFDSRFYYLKDKASGRRFRFSGRKTYYGSTVFCCQGDIYMGDNSNFPGRTVFIARNGNIELGSNVQLSNAVIIADRSVIIGSGCKIKGVIYGDIIRIRGKSEFIKDEKIVAHFSSRRFISF